MVLNRGEDKPLLVSFLDGACGKKGSDEEGYSEGKWGRPQTKGKWPGKGRGRARGMALGAASVINRWPDHLTICWLIAMGSVMMLVACILMLSGAGRRPPGGAFSGPGAPALLTQRCQLRKDHADRLLTPTILTNVYLHIILNDEDVFDQAYYRSAIKSAAKSHPNHIINVYVLLNDTLDMHDYRRNSRFEDWEIYHQGIERHKFFDTSSADLEDEPNVPSFPEDKKEPFIPEFDDRINIVRSTFSNYFKHSPISNVWKTISREMVPVAMRVLTLWENGGIVMPWKMFLDRTDYYTDETSASGQLRHLVLELKKNFTVNAPVNASDGVAKKRLIDADLGGMNLESAWDFLDSDVKNLHIDSNELNIGKHQKEINLSQVQMIVDSSMEPVHKMDAVRELLKELDSDSYMDMALDSDDYYYYSDETIEDSEGNEGKKSAEEKMKAEFKKQANATKQEPKLKVEKVLKVVEVKKDEHLKLAEEPKKDAKKGSNLSSQEDKLNLKMPERVEFVLRPPVSTDHLENEIHRMVKTNFKGKPHNGTITSKIKKRVKREIYAISQDYPSFFDSLSIESMLKERLINDAIMRDLMLRDPFAELLESDMMSMESLPKGGGEVVLKKPSKDVLALQKDLFGKRSETVSEEDDYEEAAVIQRPQKLKFAEQTGFRKYKAFDYMNVFAMPNKLTLTLDPFGYYFATKKPCNAFLGQVISILQVRGKLEPVEDLIPDALRTFCRDKKFSDCPGIALL